MKFSWGTSASNTGSRVGNEISATSAIKAKGGEFVIFLPDNSSLYGLAAGSTYSFPGNESMAIVAADFVGTTFVNYTASDNLKYYFQNSSTTATLAGIWLSDTTFLGADYPIVLIREELDNSTKYNWIAVRVNQRDATNNYVGWGQPYGTTLATTLQSWGSDTFKSSGMDAYGTYVTYYNPTGTTETVIYYPDTQAIATVAFGLDPVITSSSSTQVEVAQKITSPVAKFASEVDTDTLTSDLILVGGPCANTLVATLAADNTTGIPTCEDWDMDSTGIIKEVTNAFGSGQKALVVAGTNAADTRSLAAMVMEGTLDYSA
jgi:hypothetical protein